MAQHGQLAFDFATAAVLAQAAEPATAVSQPLDSAVPVASLADVVAPLVWHHPRANRAVRLAHCDVAYEFKRGQRRTIGLSVSPEGLSVSAPKWAPVGEVDAFVQSKSDWILDKLRVARERRQALDEARVQWADGARFELLGQPVRLCLDPTHGFSGKGAALQPTDGGWSELRLGLPHHATETQIRDAAQAWLMRHATAYFRLRLDHFAPQVGVSYRALRLSGASTRWGSASADGTIRLNWRLIHLTPDMVDYVVVHELSHLRHMDHSPRFWDVVASVMPDHLERRAALKLAAVPLDD